MERDLIFTLQAVQLGLADPDTVAASRRAVERGDSPNLRTSLIQRAELAESDVAYLELAVERVLKQHDGDADRTLAALGLHTQAEALGLWVPEPPSQTADGDDEARPRPRIQLTDDTVTPEAEGRYRALQDDDSDGREIGRGGMGRLLLTYDRHLGREVAVKELLEDDEPEEESPDPATVLTRFLREARVLGQLEHPGVVPVYELGQRADGTLYYTMKHVQGQTLVDALQQCKTLYDRLSLLPHVIDLCQTVAFAHQHDVVHRDLRPDTVYLGSYGETVLVDWGLARIRGQRDLRAEDLARAIKTLQDADAGLAPRDAPLLRPAYVSPEHAAGDLEAIDEQSDVWSLGALLYEVLTGHPPVTGDTDWEVLGNVGTASIPPPKDAHDGIPAELSAVCMQALTRDKSQRYRTAADLATELLAFQAGGRVQAYEYSSWELLRGLVRRNLLLTLVLLVGVGLLVTGSALIYQEYETAQQAQRQEHQDRQAAERARRHDRQTLVQERDRRRQGEQKARKAHKVLAAAYLDRAQRLLRRRRYASAGIFAAASLLHNPHNPRSPWRFPHAGPPASIRENELLAGAQSVLYRVGLERVLTHRRTLPTRNIRGWRLTFSRDGGYLAHGGSSADVWLWSLSDHKPVGPFKAPAKPVIAVAFSPDGRRLAAAGGGGAVRIWSVPDGKVLATLKAHLQLATALDFSPDGKFLATAGTDRAIRIWDLQQYKVERTFKHPNISVWSVRFSPDGKLIASAGWQAGQASRVRVWEVKTGRAVVTLSDPVGPIWVTTFSPDGSLLVAAGLDKVIRVYHTRKARLLHALRGHTGDVTDVAFSPDGKRLASVSTDHTIRLWSTRSWEPLSVLQGHRAPIWGVAFSPDGRRLATTSWDRTVKLWRVRLRPATRTFGADAPMVQAARSGKGTLLVGAGLDRRFVVWRLRDGKRLRTLRPDMKGPTLFAVSPGAPLLATVHPNQTLWIWDLRTGQRRWILTGQRQHDTRVLAFRADGTQLAAGDAKGRVRIWDIEQRKTVRQFRAGTGKVESLAWSPDGAKLAVAVASASGKRGPVALWSPTTGKRIRSLGRFTGSVLSLAFAPDGKRLAAACDDYAIRIWNASTGRLARGLVGHGDDVFSVTWSPDGRLLSSISRDNTVRIWRTDTGLLLHRYDLEQVAFRAPFTPDGKGYAVPGPAGVQLLPVSGPLWQSDPRALLKNSEAAASRRLDGFTLTTVAGGPQTLYR